VPTLRTQRQGILGFDDILGCDDPDAGNRRVYEDSRDGFRTAWNKVVYATTLLRFQRAWNLLKRQFLRQVREFPPRSSFLFESLANDYSVNQLPDQILPPLARRVLPLRRE
jgi:hypothetical protein